MIKFTTKSEAVRVELRRRIVGRELRPGQKIVISDIAKEFGISGIPVREAIKKLESEGLVKFTPHVGAVVNVIGDDEFIEIYLMRIELEALATKLSAPHMSHEDIEHLWGIVEKAEQAIKAGNIEQLGKLNKNFHLKIYKTGPYPFLYKTIVDLWERIELMQCVFHYTPERAVPSWGEHREIVAALEEKDSEKAAMLVRQQKNKTRHALEKKLATGVGTGPPAELPSSRQVLDQID